MGFFSKVFGIDKGIDITARNAIEHMQQIQKYVNNRDELIKYLSMNNINYAIDKSFMDDTKENLRWAIQVSKMQVLQFMHSDNFIQGYFDEMQGNPLEPVSFLISDISITYSIDMAYEMQGVPLPSMCQTFINSLQTRNIQKGF